MTEQRWRQRLENFTRAMAQLRSACQQERYSELERAGLIQMFEFSLELAWKTLKDWLAEEGYRVVTPRETIRQSFEAGLLSEEDAQLLLEALRHRNLLAHTYWEELAETAVESIKLRYFPVLERLLRRLQSR